VLRERGLGDALRVFARAVPLRIQVEDRSVGRAPSGVEVAVYYCALEAIQNAVKHAGPRSSLTVALAQADGRIEFQVSDDGTGFDTDERYNGLGLVSMRDLLAAVGGEVLITSSPGNGTTVAGSVPVGHAVPDRPEGELGP
jgi:two-component system, NarL family, sensor kinase